MDARVGLGFAAVQRHLLVGFGLFLPAVILGLEVSLSGVWRLPSFCHRMQGWQMVGVQDSAGIKVRGLEVTG